MQMRLDCGFDLTLIRHCLNDQRRELWNNAARREYPACRREKSGEPRLIHAPELAQQVLRMNRLGKNLEIVSLRVSFFQKVSRGGLS